MYGVDNYTCTGVLSIELLQIIKSLHCLIKRSASGQLSVLRSLPIRARERRNMVSTIIYINTREGAPSEVIFWNVGFLEKPVKIKINQCLALFSLIPDVQ